MKMNVVFALLSFFLLTQGHSFGHIKTLSHPLTILSSVDSSKLEQPQEKPSPDTFTQCVHQLHLYLINITLFDDGLAINQTENMLLYSGTGIQALGMYEDCQELDYAHYCLMSVATPEGVDLRTGLCLPTQCKEQDLGAVFTWLFTNISNAYNESWVGEEAAYYFKNDITFNCANKGFEKPNGSAITVFFFLALLGFFCLVGGLLEYSRNRDKQRLAAASTPTATAVAEPPTEKKALLSNQGSIKSINDLPKGDARLERPKRVPIYISFFLAFSPIENFKKLLVPTAVPSLASLNGLRTLSMCWVILGHTVYWASFTTGYQNPDHIRYYELPTFTAQFMINATFSVDAFFYMSGFLVAYLCHQELKKKGKINIVMYYFHRFWRLSPPYFVALVILWKCLPYFGNGPFWYQVDTYSSRTVCDKYWWSNLLYINNFVPSDYDSTCMGWSWYLANDMQMYILTPIYIFAFWKSKILGWVVLIVSCIASLIINFVLVHKHGYTDYLPELEVNDGYDTEVYSKFYTRITAWLVGIAGAWILVWHEERKVKTVPAWLQIALWTIAATLLGLTIFGTTGQYQRECRQVGNLYCEWNRAQTELYLTFSRTAFSIGIAIMMHMCYIGKGYFIDSILSFRLWDVMARLTFSAYLYHPILMSIVYFNSVSFFNYSITEIAIHFVSFTVMAFVAAILSFLLIEKPMMNLEKLLHPPPRQK